MTPAILFLIVWCILENLLVKYLNPAKEIWEPI